MPIALLMLVFGPVLKKKQCCTDCCVKVSCEGLRLRAQNLLNPKNNTKNNYNVSSGLYTSQIGLHTSKGH